jgi:drug/metabolite transporter (DMT)-like permease
MKKVFGYLTLCLIWGNTWMAIKIGLNDLTPFFSLGVRYLIAGICLGAFLLLKDRTISIKKGQVKLILLITFLNYIIPYSMIYWAEQHIYSNLTAVIYAMFPLNVALLSPFFLKEEKMTVYDYAGILIGFAGTVIIFAESLLSEMTFHFWGIFAVYIGSISSAIISIILKKDKTQYHPLKINLWPILLTGIFITLFSLFVEDLEKNVWSASAVVSVVYLSIFGTVVGFTVYFWMIRQIKLILLSSISYVIPMVAIIAGWIYLREMLTGYQIIGSLLVLAGVFISTRRPKPKYV